MRTGASRARKRSAHPHKQFGVPWISMVHCVKDEFNSRGDAKFIEDPEQVFLDRMLTQLQFQGHASIGQAFGNQSDNLLFARSEEVIPV